MPSAATYDDIGFEEPARRKPARKSSSRTKGRRKGPRFRADVTKVARYAALGLAGTVTIGIMVNALVMQKGHHPAPLFGTSVPVSEAARPVPAAQPAKPSHAAEQATPAEMQKADAPLPPAKPHHEVIAKTANDDPIAKLLKTSTSSEPPEKSDAKTVLGVQQALVKLGYVLKPNGTLGPTTKKAIEMFEKDRHLPVNGDVSHRLVKILSAESGLKIN